MIAKGRVYLRKEPNFNGEVVRIVEKEEVIEVHDFKEAWAVVEEGFILSEYLIDKK